MSLESATYINELVVTNPVGASDPKSKGDDHIRLIKTVIKNTFPNITGQVTATQEELNRLSDAIGEVEIPVVFAPGTKMLFCQASAPTGWVQDSAITDHRLLRVTPYGWPGGGVAGTNDCWIMNVVPSHTHDLSMDAGGGHTHRVYGSIDNFTDDFIFTMSGKYLGIGNVSTDFFVGADYPSTPTGPGYYTNFSGSSMPMLEAASSHTHSGSVAANSSASNWEPKVVDAIIAVKS